MYILIIKKYQRKNYTKFWYLNKFTHRKNGPAIENLMGCNLHYLNGEHFILQENGTRHFFCINGKLHREEGLPAIEYSNGDKEWWFKGIRHRNNNLPAVIIGDKQFWFENGEFIKCII